MSRDSPFSWESQPKCIIIMADFLERSKSYAYFIKEDGPLVDLPELQMVKRIVSAFVVDKGSHKCCRSTKDTVIKVLISVRVNPLTHKMHGIFHVAPTFTQAYRLLGHFQSRPYHKRPHMYWIWEQTEEPVSVFETHFDLRRALGRLYGTHWADNTSSKGQNGGVVLDYDWA